MLGLETVDTQLARATTIEQRVVSAAPAAEVLSEARAAFAAAAAELKRDEAALDLIVRGAGGPPSFDPTRAYGGLIGSTALVDAQQEVAADRTALARLAESLRQLNQRVDADTYTLIDDRAARLEEAELDVDHVVLLTSAGNDARALELYNRYRPGQFVTAAEATTFALMTTDRPADAGALQTDYVALLRRSGTIPITAALLATVRDVDGSYTRFASFRSSGHDPDVAALLAVSAKPEVSTIFRGLTALDVPPRYAALVGTAAAEAGVTADRATETLRYFAPGRPPRTAALLAAVALASGRELDQIAAAQSRFIRAGYGRPDLATAAWALAGRSSITMASLATIVELERPPSAQP